MPLFWPLGPLFFSLTFSPSTIPRSCTLGTSAGAALPAWNFYLQASLMIPTHPVRPSQRMLCFFERHTIAVRENYLLTIYHLYPKRMLSAAVRNRKPDKQVAQTEKGWFFADVKEAGDQSTLEVIVLLSASAVCCEGFSWSFLLVIK